MEDDDDDDFTNAIISEKTHSNEVIVDKIPPYGNRSGWVPRTVEVNYYCFLKLISWLSFVDNLIVCIICIIKYL